MNTETATAPGQPTARELLEVFRVRGISDGTQVMGLVGSATAHSISHHLHNAAFAALSLDAVYLPLEVHDLAAFVTRMVRTGTRELEWNLRGLSITAPYKSDVIKYLDHIEPAAKEIGAVNTIVLNDGELHGYNTDAAGFIQPLIEKLGAVSGLRCAVIGSGGVARTVCWALKNKGALVTVFARSVERGRALADDFALEFELLNYRSMAGFDVLVNSTSVGTKGISEAETVFTADQLRGVGLAYDLVYNPRETRFLREAARAGCGTLGGLSMLLMQAKLQFCLWTNRECPEGVMEAAAEEFLV
jgi:shikimate dehydrogenase